MQLINPNTHKWSFIYHEIQKLQEQVEAADTLNAAISKFSGNACDIYNIHSIACDAVAYLILPWMPNFEIAQIEAETFVLDANFGKYVDENNEPLKIISHEKVYNIRSALQWFRYLKQQYNITNKTINNK